MRNYRGLTKDGKWVYGWYAKIEEKHCIITTEAQFDYEEDYNVIFKGIIEVIPETVGQSTGEGDNNNKEIYGGDCFKTSSKHGYSSNCMAEVLWDESSCAFVVQIHRQDELGVGPELLPDFKRNFPDSFIVIGNIHQNPELENQNNDND